MVIVADQRATFGHAITNGEGEFDLAKEYYENVLDKTPNIIKLYENEIKCELLFYEILNENMEKVKELYTKELRNYIK